MSAAEMTSTASSTLAANATPTRRRLQRKGRSRRHVPLGERLIEWLLMACGSLSLFIAVGVVVLLGGETWAFFQEVSLGAFFTDFEWTPLFANKHFGIWPLVSGTVLISGIALAVALPCGLLAAIYLSELASPRARRLLKPALEVLAGVPTIVYGYFALVVLTPILQKMVPDLASFNALSAGVVMGIMIMPMVSSLSEDALHAVPRGLREASLALGAGQIPTITRVVLPSAFSGIAASSVLALSRAVGETMIVAIAAGQQPRFGFDPRVPIETMTAYIVQVSMGDTPTGTLEYRTIFAVGSMLFLMTFAMNLVSQRFTRRVRLEAI